MPVKRAELWSLVFGRSNAVNPDKENQMLLGEVVTIAGNVDMTSAPLGVEG